LVSTTTEELEVKIDDGDSLSVDGEHGAKKLPDGKEAAAADSKDAKTEVSPDEGLEKLKKQLDDERARADKERIARLAAESDAQAARESEAKAKGDAQGSQLDMVKTAIATATGNIDTLKGKLAAALEANDYAAAAEVQYAMSENASNLSSLKQAQSHLEKAPKPEVRPRNPGPNVESFAAEVAKNGYPRSAAWVRAHGEYITDPAKHRKMIAAHELALADGIAADTDEYFKSIEETLKIKAPAREEPRLDDDATADTAAVAKGGRDSAPASAPVARSGSGTNGTSNGARQRSMTLTPEQIEAAAISGVTPEEYAKNLLAIQKSQLN
jgi:hypothetical protein